MVRGTGPQLPADLVHRLTTEGAGANGVSRGVHLRNYYAPKRSRFGRGRGGGGAPDPYALVDYAIERLMVRLRAQPGINVRLPSHQAPPFRAVGFTFTARIAPLGANATVLFNGQSAVPEGRRGVVAQLRHSLLPNGALTLPGTTIEGNRISVLKNTTAVAGWTQIPAAFLLLGLQGLPPGNSIAGNSFWYEPSVPIILEPGDRLELVSVFVGAGDVEFDHVVSLAGYTYPIEVEADGIEGTLADRGRIGG